jgi:hypothetical protein
MTAPVFFLGEGLAVEKWQVRIDASLRLSRQMKRNECFFLMKPVENSGLQTRIG